MGKFLTPHIHWCLRRAFITMWIVGPVLTLINQWEVILTLDLNWWKVALTFVVPFVVSLSGSLPGHAKE
ncbi:hypothetical protein MNBD_ALPHA06-595 [hydrothermal vent metagenome]|uniref:Uncharacterized protein n=1 Tax=hydrothermal vent metagenome TaxID=652676 RepID=A0A3B0RD78_9ZZZZ